MDLSVTIGPARLANPVCVASGTFGYGSEYEQLIELPRLGALFTKAVTAKPRPGNSAPRIVETPSGMLNSIGLANVGVDRFIVEKIPFFEKLPCAIVANIAGSTLEEYVEVARRLEDHPLWGYEINLSCPNVKEGGLSFGTSCPQVEQVTNAVRRVTSRPLIVKLTPNVTDIGEIARAAEEGGADALTCINTVLGMVIDVRTRRPVLPGGTGGLSGPAILPIGVAATYRAARAVGIPIFGVGGIMDADGALQYLIAGASAVQIGTGNFADPSTAVRVLDGIIAHMSEHGISCIEELHTSAA